VNVLDILAVHLHKIQTRSLLLSGGGRQTPVRVREEHEDALSNWLSRITELQLIDIELYHPDNFYTCCPLLERLTFVTIARRSHYVIGRTVPATLPTMYPPHLHTIRIFIEHFVYFPPWLLSPGWRPLDRLELYAWDGCDLSVLAYVIGRSVLPAYTIYMYIAVRMGTPLQNPLLEI
jgi:hypothetical protein